MEKFKTFIRESRKWSTVSSGAALFELAATVLQSVLDMDAGMFVYKKHLFVKDSHPHVYCAWGVNESEDDLTVRVSNDGVWFSQKEFIHGEKWLDAETTIQPWREFWATNGIKKIGVWPIIIGNKSAGGIVLGRTSGDFADDADILSLCATQISLILEMLSSKKQVEFVSNHDPLTNILNRRGLAASLERFEQHDGDTKVIVGILDVDNFKTINDNEGHKCGDSVLVDIAETLSSSIGDDGICARVGGDEMVFLLNTHQGSATTENQVLSWFSEKPYSVTVGCAEFGNDGTDWETSFKVADQRLYNKKSERQ